MPQPDAIFPRRIVVAPRHRRLHGGHLTRQCQIDRSEPHACPACLALRLRGEAIVATLAAPPTIGSNGHA
jgi:hypothetical protein